MFLIIESDELEPKPYPKRRRTMRAILLITIACQLSACNLMPEQNDSWSIFVSNAEVEALYAQQHAAYLQKWHNDCAWMGVGNTRQQFCIIH